MRDSGKAETTSGRRRGGSAAPAIGEPGHGRVLVAEDEQDVAELIRYHLTKDGFVEPRTVDVHMARLRAKFLAAKREPPGVETVRGVGYRFREPPDS